ncbi:MAG: response regulator, partial [Pseudomonadota bacterium]
TVEAADADEALEVLARKSDIDLVFSDIIMPGSMTGLELAHQLRASYPALKVLLTTGFAGEARPEDPATDLNGLLHGFELLQKPYRQADLAQALRRLLGDD